MAYPLVAAPAVTLLSITCVLLLTQHLLVAGHDSPPSSSLNSTMPPHTGLPYDDDDYYYIINPKETCSSVADIFLLVYVHSAPSHSDRRLVIRHTWANVNLYRQYADVIVRVIFVVGLSDIATNQAMAVEAQQYGDVIQARFVDTYRNLTYKATAALRWVASYCAQAKYVLKSDDDIFINMFAHIDRLRQLFTKGNSGRSGAILCMVFYGVHAMREGKWEVDLDLYPHKVYPDFCSGSAFTLTSDAVVSLHRASRTVPFLPVDDVYVTGILRQHIPGLRHVQLAETYMLRDTGMVERFTGPERHLYTFCQMTDIRTSVPTWNHLVKLSLPSL